MLSLLKFQISQEDIIKPLFTVISKSWGNSNVHVYIMFAVSLFFLSHQAICPSLNYFRPSHRTTASEVSEFEWTKVENLCQSAVKKICLV